MRLIKKYIELKKENEKLEKENRKQEIEIETLNDFLEISSKHKTELFLTINKLEKQISIDLANRLTAINQESIDLFNIRLL